MQIHQGWLSGVSRCPSPNCNPRPCGEVSLLVIHNISLPPGEYENGYIQDFFCNQLDKEAHPYFSTIAHLEVSSHLLITRQGAIVQFVSFEQRAWHAGKSFYQGRDNCNDFSVGIELEGTDCTSYEAVQYDRLALVTQALLDQYPRLCQEAIVGHEHIAPSRKTDPGPSFDWKYYFSKL